MITKFLNTFGMKRSNTRYFGNAVHVLNIHIGNSTFGEWPRESFGDEERPEREPGEPQRHQHDDRQQLFVGHSIATRPEVIVVVVGRGGGRVGSLALMPATGRSGLDSGFYNGRFGRGPNDARRAGQHGIPLAAVGQQRNYHAIQPPVEVHSEPMRCGRCAAGRQTVIPDEQWPAVIVRRPWSVHIKQPLSDGERECHRAGSQVVVERWQHHRVRSTAIHQ